MSSSTLPHAHTNSSGANEHLHRIQIQIDNQPPSYNAGENITGKVIVTLAEQQIHANLSITCEGKTQIHWTDIRAISNRKSTSRSVTYSKHYEAEESIFNDEIVLLSKFSIPPGTSTYPFSFTLPLNIPTTYSSKYGSVVYSISAKLNADWTTPVPFALNGILDLNTEIEATQRIEVQQSKYLCCWPICLSGPIEITLSIPRSGFIPGDIIPLTVEIVNGSIKRIIHSKAKLLQVIHYHAKGTYKLEENILASANGPAVNRGESSTWSDHEALRIPPCPPTNLAGSCIIKIQYYIELELISSAVFDLFVILQRVIVGTIPLSGIDELA